MEIRVLQYFLAIAREQTISGAAEVLHITQPTLSRQIKDLEDELGKQLFVRSNKKISLTEDGLFLRQRAEEIVNLVDKTELEMMTSDLLLSGEIYIGSGECHALKVITKSMKKMQTSYPAVKFDIHSGNAPDIIDRIDSGLIDFGLITHHPKVSEYNHIIMPIKHHWGVLIRKDDPLAQKEQISYEDIADKPLIVSKEIANNIQLTDWFKNNIDQLNIISTYTLLYNATLMVEDELGYAVCLDKLINTSGDSELCFRPLNPFLEVTYYFIWKKYNVLSKASKQFLNIIQEIMNTYKHIDS
ncbi:LysR family transcriptional regulator [Thomasclavelia sp.]